MPILAKTVTKPILKKVSNILIVIDESYNRKGLIQVFSHRKQRWEVFERKWNLGRSIKEISTSKEVYVGYKVDKGGKRRYVFDIWYERQDGSLAVRKTVRALEELYSSQMHVEIDDRLVLFKKEHGQTSVVQLHKNTLARLDPNSCERTRKIKENIAPLFKYNKNIKQFLL